MLGASFLLDEMEIAVAAGEGPTLGYGRGGGSSSVVLTPGS